MIDRRTVLGAAAATLAATTVRAQSRTVEPPCGPLRGLAGQGVQAFLGIPYAAPPVGQLRYASPKPAPRWSEIRDASRGGAAAIQTIPPWAAWLYETPEHQDEDCLFLNVWTPDPAGKRPVMVWIHGGAWRTGRGDAIGSQGAALAAAGDVVVVTINYRLGALGWLAHPALTDPATGAFANWGFQDQVLALRWVQQNIAAFGGDPGRVTLFGQSAGGTSVAVLAGDQRNAGLIHRMIIESGALVASPAAPDVPPAAAYTEALAKRLGVSVPGLRTVPAPLLHTEELALSRDPAVASARLRSSVSPVLDGVVMQTWPRDITLPPMPLLIGTTRTEGTFWYDLVGPDGKPIPGLPAPKDRATLLRMIPDAIASYRPESAHLDPETVAQSYESAARARGEPDGPVPIWVAIYTDLVFRLRSREAAARHAHAGQPTYLYEFDHPLAPPAHGVPHTAEIPFVFGTYSHPFFAGKVGAGPAEAALSEAVLGAWARFAHDGAPGPDWTAGMAVNLLGGAALHSVVAQVRPEESAVWS